MIDDEDDVNSRNGDANNDHTHGEARYVQRKSLCSESRWKNLRLSQAASRAYPHQGSFLLFTD